MAEYTNDSSLDYVYYIRNKMRIHNFMLAYRGAFSQEITKALLASTEKKLALEGTGASIQKKVFYVMVECLQNICKHNDTDNNPAVFMIGGEGDDYVIYSGNVIRNDKIEGLRNKLVAINSMSRDELKEMYKSLMASAEFSESGGAGLGLIDIAKKSGSKLGFGFEKIDDQYAFFSLRTTISGAEKGGGENISSSEAEKLFSFGQNGNTVSYIREFHDLMRKNHLVMIYEGAFNQEITKIVLALTEKKLDAEGMEVAVRKKIFNVMMESLQNICKHQYPDTDNSRITHSIFMIGNKESKDTAIISGNVLSPEVIPVIKSRIDQINTLDRDGLKQLYKDVRINSTISEVGGAGLGFIDMARKSGNKLHYHFNEINEKLYFFTLKSTVANKESES